MKNIVLTLLALVTLSFMASAQNAPQIDYSKYGSASRQMTVYSNLKSRQAQLERQRYRKFRAEVRRDLQRRRYDRRSYVIVRPRTTIVIRGRRSYLR